MSVSPLSKPVARQQLHRRRIEMHGYQREDGLFDIEAHLTDTKAYSFPNRFRGGTVAAGEPIHDMWIRLTIDEHLVIQAAEAATAAAPYPVCPAIAGRYQQLVGVRIGPGWRGTIKRLLGGTQGCTHLSELLAPMATTAYQTLVGQRRRRTSEYTAEKPPPILDTCHAYARDGDVVKQVWPAFYTGDDNDER